MCDEICCLSNPEVISTYRYWYHLFSSPYPFISTQFLMIFISLIISQIFGYGISHCLISFIVCLPTHDPLPYDIFQLRSMVKILSFLLVMRYFCQKNFTHPETGFAVLEEAQMSHSRALVTRVASSPHRS